MENWRWPAAPPHSGAKMYFRRLRGTDADPGRVVPLYRRHRGAGAASSAATVANHASRNMASVELQSLLLTKNWMPYTSSLLTIRAPVNESRATCASRGQQFDVIPVGAVDKKGCRHQHQGKPRKIIHERV